MTTYADWLVSLLPAPLAGFWGRRWVAVQGAELDGLLAQSKESAKAGFVEIAPADAMPAHGRDRQIDARPGETTGAYRARLIAAWSTWSWATTDRGVREAILLAGYGAPTFYTQAQLAREPVARGWWARFTLVFSGRFVWDGHAVWDAVTWDFRHVAPIEDLTDAEIRAGLRPLLTTWKSARDRVTSVIIAQGGWLWDTGDRWDTGIEWDKGTHRELAADPWDSGWRWDSPPIAWDYFL